VLPVSTYIGVTGQYHKASGMSIELCAAGWGLIWEGK